MGERAHTLPFYCESKALLRPPNVSLRSYVVKEQGVLLTLPLLQGQGPCNRAAPEFL